jgi:hypothetical protein
MGGLRFETDQRIGILFVHLCEGLVLKFRDSDPTVIADP